MNIETMFRLVVLGMFLVFSGVAWGMWDLHKRLTIIEEYIKEDCPCEKE